MEIGEHKEWSHSENLVAEGVMLVTSGRIMTDFYDEAAENGMADAPDNIKAAVGLIAERARDVMLEIDDIKTAEENSNGNDR